MEESTSTPSAPLSEETESRRDLMKALALCLLAVVVVRSFFFEPFKIPSSSMVPTLRIGDHIFVSKFNYGLTVPFTKKEFIRFGEPKRGEVIVFLFPRDESLHYIKRVVGIPGDRIQFRGRELFINDEPVEKELVTDPIVIGKLTGLLYKEKLGGITHYVKHSSTPLYDFSDLNRTEVVPPDKFFVMGDNRDDSYDSRSWGFVPRENIKGRAQMVWLSLDQDHGWGLDRVRWDRCGTLIH